MKVMITNFYVNHKVQGQQREIKRIQNSKHALCAQAKAIVDMTTTMMEKAKILEKSLTLQLFTML